MRGGLPSTPYLRCTLAAHTVRVHARLGNYAEAERMLASLPDLHPDVAVAEALLLLYRDDSAGALRRVEGVTGFRLSPGQRVEVALIAAAAHWIAGDADAAIESFAEAGGLARERGLHLILSSVPYDALEEVAVAARDAGAIDLVDEVRTLPTTMRVETFEPLTKAELRTLEVLATGVTLSRIAQELFITENTVKFHLRKIYRKLRASGRAEAVERAQKMRLIPLEESE